MLSKLEEAEVEILSLILLVVRVESDVLLTVNVTTIVAHPYVIASFGESES
jgi:hypothetical protein